MKRLLVLLPILFLSACSDRVLTQKQLEQAEEYCSDKEGIYHLRVKDSFWAHCKDGSKKSLGKGEKI